MYLESLRDCKELALLRPIAKYTIVPRLFLHAEVKITECGALFVFAVSINTPKFDTATWMCGLEAFYVAHCDCRLIYQQFPVGQKVFC